MKKRRRSATCLARLGFAAPCVLGWLIAGAGSGRAQPEKREAPTGAAASQAIVVTGRLRASREQVAAYVRAYLSKSHNDQVPLWGGTVCARVIGLDDPQQDFFVSRLRDTLALAGVRFVRGDRCGARIVAVFVASWDDVLNRLPARQAASVASVPRPTREAPVRWTSSYGLRGADGERPINYYIPASEGGTPRSFPGVNAHAPSRISTGGRVDLEDMLVIVDASRLGHVSNNALASYIAFVAAANANVPAAAPASVSILNLFSAPRLAPSDGALSTLDRAYLEALYRGSRNVSFARKTADVATAMLAR